MPSNNYAFLKKKLKDMVLNRVRIPFGKFSELDLSNTISLLKAKKHYLYIINTLALIAKI